MSDVGVIKAGVVVERRVSVLLTLAWSLILLLPAFSVAGLGGFEVVYKVKFKVDGRDKLFFTRTRCKLLIGGSVKIYIDNDKTQKCSIEPADNLPIERKRRVKGNTVKSIGVIIKKRIPLKKVLVGETCELRLSIKAHDVRKPLFAFTDIKSPLKVGDQIEIVYNPEKPKWCEIVEGA